MLIDDLEDFEISALSRVLQHRPNESVVSYAGRVMSNISVLDSHLKRPNRVSSLVLPSQKLFTPLCKLHKLMNATIVHALFNLVALEAGRRLNSLVSNNHKLTEIERIRVQSLRELHSLWLEPAVYQKTFFDPPDEKKWKYQADGCEACMLSRIGSDMTVLLNIRMALLSRMSSKKVRRHGPPRLMPWIERWVASLSTAMNMSTQDFDELISANDHDGNQLKAIRKQLWHERRLSRRAFRASQQKQKIRSTQVSDGEIVTPTLPQPTVRVSAATTTTTSTHAHVEDASDSSEAENDIVDAFSALTSTPYLPSIASTVSFHQRPKTYIFPVTLTTHSNSNIEDVPKQGVRPLPTNFSAVASHTIRDDIHRSKSQGHRSSSSSLKPLMPPELSSTNSNSHYDSFKLISPADSYAPPKFPVHPAYIFPTAAAHAKRYQNLLSPHPMLRDSEEELRIPETPGLPKRSSKRTTPPMTEHHLPAQTTNTDSPSSAEPRPVSTFTIKENDRYNNNSSPLPSMSRSQPSRMSGVSPISEYSNYKADGEYSFSSANLAPPALPSKSTSKPRVVSTFTIKEGEVEPDWYAQKNRASQMGRSKTMQEHSRASRVSTVSATSEYSEYQDDSRRGTRVSDATDLTRWSGLYKHLLDDTKKEAR